MSDELRAAARRYTNPKPAAAYPYPCNFHEQPAQRSADAALLARAWIAEHPADEAEPVTPAWLAARGAVQDPEHPDEWMLPVIRDTEFGDTYRLTVGLTPPAGVTWECLSETGRTLDCVTLVYGDLTCGRLRLLCRALNVPLPEPVTPAAP